MQTDFLQFMFQAINNLLTQNLGFFDAMGQNLFRMFATILIAWYGIKSALSAASGKYTFQFDNFASLLLTISFRLCHGQLLQHADSRHRHELSQPRSPMKRSSLPASIDQAELQTIVDRIRDFEARIDAPGCHRLSRHGDLHHRHHFAGCAQAISIVVIAYGFIATAVCVLVGPIFVPFFIVPKLEWLFWGWLRCFLQYAFYQVIAAAVVYIIGNLIIGVLTLQGTGNISTLQLIGWFPVLLITFVASIYVLLKVPALTNHIFSGTAGGSSAGILEAPAAAAAHCQGALMDRDPSFQDAKRLYLESYGDPMVTNTYLKIALVLVSLVAVGSGARRSANHPHVRELPAPRHPHRRPRPRGSHQLPQLRIQAAGRRSQILPVAVHQALLPPEPLHHSG